MATNDLRIKLADYYKQPAKRPQSSL